MASEYEDQEFRRFLEDIWGNTKSFAKSAGRGVVAGALGLPGDMLNLVRPSDPYAPETEPRLFTSEGMSRQLADTYPSAFGYADEKEPSAMEKISEFFGQAVTPGPEEYGRLASELAAGSAAMAAAVKNKGGNWLERSKPGKLDEVEAIPETEAILEIYDSPGYNRYYDIAEDAMRDDVGVITDREANLIEAEVEELLKPIEDWFAKVPLQWRRKFLGTADDPMIELTRARGGFDVPGGERITDWEEFGDSLISMTRKESLRPDESKDFPWLDKVPDDEPLYKLNYRGDDSLQNIYAHMADVLMEDPNSTTPEFWKNLSFPQAMSRVMDFDAAQAKKMDVASGFEGTTRIKDYEDGSAWVKIDGGEELPDDSTKIVEQQRAADMAQEEFGDVGELEAELVGQFADENGLDFDDLFAEIYEGEQVGIPPEVVRRAQQFVERGLDKKIETETTKRNKRIAEALKKEGDNMGHCVGGSGYCEAVKRGETEIYSLRDSTGGSHVTIEANPVSLFYSADKFPDPTGQYDNFHQLVQARRSGDGDYERVAKRLAEEYGIEVPLDIRQIKGKQNRTPDAKYQQQVVDFLNSKKWGRVQELPKGVIDIEDHFPVLSKSGVKKVVEGIYPELKRRGIPRVKDELGSIGDFVENESKKSGTRFYTDDSWDEFYVNAIKRFYGL